MGYILVPFEENRSALFENFENDKVAHIMQALV